MGEPAKQSAVDGAERRAFPRFDLMAQVRVKRGKIDFMMELSNISMSGALVDMGSLRAPGWVKKGRVVEIGIVHPVDFETISVQGKIVRLLRNGGTTQFAVHFEGLDEAAKAGIARLHDAAGPPESGPALISERPNPPPLPRKPPPLPSKARVVPPPLPSAQPTGTGQARKRVRKKPPPLPTSARRE